MNEIEPGRLKSMLRDGAELALLDVREQGPFSRCHLLFAACVPLSRLELMIDDLVPRRVARTVIVDGGEDDEAGLAPRAALRLGELGYTDVAVLRGGVEGWRAAGYELFSGVNVPSKAFGEVVEQTCGTPLVTPQSLRARLDSGERIVIVDARPMDEYRRMSIPGGVDVPGAELAYRVQGLLPDADTPVVVNCAGRTRSIIGAQSLINVGTANPVAALKGGTMGWRLAGLALEHGQTRSAPPPSAQSVARAREAAWGVARRTGVERVDRACLDAWQDDPGRSLFVFDVRGPEEYRAGHLPGSRSAPGGQLVQATDEYVGVRNARLVLVDDTEVRAAMTGSWLRQMGWPEVYVLAEGIGAAGLEQGPRRPRALGVNEGATVTVAELERELSAGGVAVLDLSSSKSHRKHHIPGAWWGVRARLDLALAAMPADARLVFTSPHGKLAHLAARDAAVLDSMRQVHVLEGGMRAWRKAGLPLGAGMERATCEVDDVWYKPYEHPGADPASMQGYLDWEVDLVEQIARDGDAVFRPLCPGS
jgi:rhodanese-related sulfurtransferase